MKRFLMGCLFMTAMWHNSNAQTTQANLYDLPKLIPPTPAAAALEKFGSIPVNYATGIPSISYPFWSWKRGRLSFCML